MNNKNDIAFAIIVVIFCCIIGIVVGVSITKNNNTHNNYNDYNDTSNNYNDNNYNDNNYNNTNNNTQNNGKDKLIEVLKNQGYVDYAGDQVIYYRNMGVMNPYGEGACAGTTLFNFRDYQYQIIFACYVNDNLAYERTETHNWKDNTLNTIINQYDYYGGQQVNTLYVNASINQYGSFTCNINNCDNYKTSMIELKNQFSNILYEANVSIYDID